MDDSISKALKKREILKSQLAEIDQYIELHRRLFGEPNEQRVSGVNPTPGARRPRKTSQNPIEVANRAEAALRNANHPLTRGQILDAITKDGFEVPAKDPAKYLGTVLWRNSERFVNIEGEGYWLKDLPLPNRNSPYV